ncbi:MAG: hypothetical protein WA637_02845 [Terriglobales bacterium]
MMISGYLLDIQPKQPRPTLALYFDAKHRLALPRGDRQAIVLDLDGVHWHATMNSTNSNNPPYVHNSLTRDHGTRCACTEVFLRLGLAEKAQLEFELTDSNNFRLVRIADKGEWRSGNAPHERTASPGTLKHRSLSPVGAGQRAPSGTRTTSFPFDDRNKILGLAGRYWELITSTEEAEERAFEQELPSARKQGFLTKSLFVRLARWKSVRQTPNYESNDEAAVRAATARAFKATDDARTALSALMQLRGVALRTASAILHWMHPDLHPILDFRVVGALGKPEPTTYEDVDFYLTIAQEVKALAQRHALDLRTIDRALWAWQKSQSR